MVEEQIYYFLHGISKKIAVVQGLLMAIHGLPPWHPTNYLGFWFLCFGLPRHFLNQHESTMRYRLKLGQQTHWFAINSHHPQDMTIIDRGIWQRTLISPDWNSEMDCHQESPKNGKTRDPQTLGCLSISGISFTSSPFFELSSEFDFCRKRLARRRTCLFKIGWLKNVETLPNYHISFTKPQSQRDFPGSFRLRSNYRSPKRSWRPEMYPYWIVTTH